MPHDGYITRFLNLGAEDEAQTRDPQLGRLMLYQLSYFRLLVKVAIPSGIPSGISAFTKATSASWEKMDSNHRRYKPADLQSAPFGHSGNFPYVSKPLSLNSTVSAPQGFLEPMEGFEPPTS